MFWIFEVTFGNLRKKQKQNNYIPLIFKKTDVTHGVGSRETANGKVDKKKSISLKASGQNESNIFWNQDSKMTFKNARNDLISKKECICPNYIRIIQ